MAILDPQTIVLITLMASLILFVSDALRYDAVAVLVVLALAASGCLSPEEAFAGFASPAVVLVASMYAFATAVTRSGVTEVLCARLFAKSDPTERWMAARIVIVAGVLSSVLSNAAVVATLIPVVGTISRRTGIPVSRLLIPLAFGSLLGGLLTLIGTSKNIVVNELIEKQGSTPFELFDFTPYAAVLLGIGVLYFLGPGLSLLPRSRASGKSLTAHYKVQKFLTEVLVEAHSDLINRSVASFELFERYEITLLGLVRAEGEETVLAPGPSNLIRDGDVLVLQGEPDAILRLRSELGLVERSAVGEGTSRLVSGDVQLVEAVVPAGSMLVGRTLVESEFRASSGLNVLALSKHGDVQPTKIGDLPLDVGDTLLIQGHKRDVERARSERRLIVLDEVRDPRSKRNAYVTVGLLALVLLLTALTPVHLSVAALGGALALVLLGCVRTDDLRRGMDWSVLILIGGMLALGRAFHKHGLSGRIADGLVGVGDFVDHPVAMLAVVLLATLLLTQVINHVAAAAMMAPVAMSIAAELGVDDRAFLMAVMTGAEFAFMSPVAHQANAMVMGPGDYRYRDFLRAGTPLTIVLVIVAVLLLPIFWPL